MTPDTGAGPPGIDIRPQEHLASCPRCGQEALLTADVPHGWDNPDGTRTEGTIPRTLCAACDHDDPDAGPLIVFLLVHDTITPATLREAAALIQRWAASLAIPAPDPARIEDEARAWRDGDL